jgi:hypothetical protein
MHNRLHQNLSAKQKQSQSYPTFIYILSPRDE